MNRIHIIIIVALLSIQYTSFGQRTWPKRNLFFLPGFSGMIVNDTLRAKKQSEFIGLIRVGYEQQIHKSFFATVTPNILLIRGNAIENGTGVGLEGGIRKFWNIEIYNRLCKPVFKDRFLISSKLNLMANSYYFNFAQSKFILGRRFLDVGVNLYPVCLDMKIYRNFYFSYQYNMHLFTRSNLKNHNLGFSYMMRK